MILALLYLYLGKLLYLYIDKLLYLYCCGTTAFSKIAVVEVPVL